MASPTPSSPLLPVAARSGIAFGIILMALSSARLLGIYISPLFFLLYLGLLLFVPYMAYRGAAGFRAYYYPAGGFSFRQGFSFVVLLHVCGGILALIPQYFYFRHALPQFLDGLQESTRTMNIQGKADLLQTFEEMRAIGVGQWLWSDYCLTILLGALWGIVVGLILRRK
nr:DUF4199 domain-containing protein [uncultured Porphyromonas sp.]